MRYPEVLVQRTTNEADLPDIISFLIYGYQSVSKTFKKLIGRTETRTVDIFSICNVRGRASLPVMVLTILVLLILTAGPLSAQPKETASLSPEKTKVVIGPFLEQLEDPEGALTLADVQSPRTHSRFRPNTYHDIHIGHTRSTWWFRFKLKKAPDHQGKKAGGNVHPAYFIEFDKPGIRSIDFYIPIKSDVQGPAGIQWIVKKTGMGRSFAFRDIPFRTYILQLPENFADAEYIYLRVQSVMSINMQVTVWSVEGMTKRVWLDTLGFGIIYGIMAAMILYNLCLLIFLKDRAYLYYIIYMASMLLHLLFGYGQLTVLFEIPPSIHQTLFWVILGNVWLWSIIFVRIFLDTPRNTPRLDRVIRVVIIVALGMILSGLFQFDRLTNIINNLLCPVGSVLGFTAAVLCIRKGFRPAWYYLIAWSVLLAGITLYAIGGILIERSFAALYTLAIGSAFEAILLSLALAERIRTLRVQKEELEIRESRLKEMMLRDGLTNLYNYRYMLARLAGEIETAQRLDVALTLLMIDVDHFKQFNDTYGHVEGDKVLQQIGGIMIQCSRQSDIACRYGGEEFTVILSGADIKDGFHAAERIRQAVAGVSFFPRVGKIVNISVSIGAASLKKGEKEEDLIKRADEALYRAKATGRNRIVIFE